MNNKIEITKVLKNSDEYTEEELKAGRLYQAGFEYNGKIYYFEKPVICYSDMPGLFKYFMVENGNEADSYTTYMYEQYRKTFNEINIDYQFNALDGKPIFDKIIKNEINYTKKEEKDVIKGIKNKSVNNSNNVKKQEAQQTRVQNTSNERKFYNVWLNDNVCAEGYYIKKDFLFKKIVSIPYVTTECRKGFLGIEIKEEVTKYRYECFPIIAEFINGKMVDIITGKTIYYADKEKSEMINIGYDKIYVSESSKINGVSYYKKEEISKGDVAVELSKLKSDDIERYKNSMQMVEKEAMTNYNNYVTNTYPQIVRKRNLENKFDSFMDDFKKRNR